MRWDRCGATRRLHVTDIGPLRASVPASAAVGRAEEALVGGPLRATRDARRDPHQRPHDARPHARGACAANIAAQDI